MPHRFTLTILKAKAWALYYLTGAQLDEQQTKLVDSFISDQVFEGASANLSLLTLRSLQPGVTLDLLDAISELAESEQLWSDAAKVLRAIDLEHLVSGIPKSLYAVGQHGSMTVLIIGSFTNFVGEVLDIEPGDQKPPGSRSGYCRNLGVSMNSGHVSGQASSLHWNFQNSPSDFESSMKSWNEA